MAITTLVQTFLHSVGETLQDISPQFSRWPERELVIYTNYGQMALAKFLPQAGSRVDVVRLLPGTKQDFTKILEANIKPGDGSTPADTYGIAVLGMSRNMGADGLTPGRVIRVVDRYTKDTNDPLWHTKTGTTVLEFMADSNTPRVVYVTPGIPTSPTVWAEVPWMAEPTRVPAGGAPGSEVYPYNPGAGSTVLLGIQDQFVEDLHNYVVAMCLMKGSKLNQNLAKASNHVSLFTASVNAQATVLTGVNPNLKALPFADQVATA